VLAYVLNLGIIAVIALLGLVLNYSVASRFPFEPVFIGWLFISAFLTICALVVQWLALSNILRWRLVLRWPFR